MTMSEKDKNTIIIAVVALLILGIIMLGIKPGVTNLKETKAANAELSAKKDAMQTEIAALPNYNTQLDTAKNDYSATAARVFGDLTNDKIHDVVLDEIVKPLGLKVTGLTIGEVSNMGIAQYAVTTGEETAAGGPTEGTIKMANVTVNVTGTQAQVIALLDKMNEIEGIYLQSASFAATDGETPISIPFYMALADTFE